MPGVWGLRNGETDCFSPAVALRDEIKWRGLGAISNRDPNRTGILIWGSGKVKTGKTAPREVSEKARGRSSKGKFREPKRKKQDSTPIRKHQSHAEP